MTCVIERFIVCDDCELSLKSRVSTRTRETTACYGRRLRLASIHSGVVMCR